jgi:hypothetical protein
MSARSASRESRSAPPEYWRQLFAEWVQKAYWHPEEAAALSLRLDPEYLRLVSATELDTAEEYAIYRERIDLIERLQRSRNEQLGPSPKAFLEWALSIQLEIPEDLKSVIERLSGSPGDWRTKFQAEQARADELQRLLDECRSNVDRLKKSELEDKRLSLQKIVIGMATKHYNYSPTKRNAAARQIADALYQLSAEHAEAGPPLSAIKLDPDTVRKFLDAAANDLENALA